MRWFRMHTDILDDPKMFELTDFQFRIFISLLALASKLEKDGEVTMSRQTLDKMLSTGRRRLDRAFLKLFELGIISSPNLPFHFLNWQKRQYKSDDSKERVRKHREMKQQSNVECNGQVTPSENRDREQIQNTDKDNTTAPPAAQEPAFKIDLAGIWMEVTKGILPSVLSLNKSRKAKIKLRLEETPAGRALEEYWREVITKISASSFCKGNGERGWRASFDWLLQPETHLRVMEGKYDDFKGGNHGTGGKNGGARDGWSAREDAGQVRGLKPSAVIQSGGEPKHE